MSDALPHGASVIDSDLEQQQQTIISLPDQTTYAGKRKSIHNVVDKGHSHHDQQCASGENIGLNESKQVSRYRFCVVSIVLTCAILVGVLVYHFTRRYEKLKFNERFDDDAKKILQSVGSNVVEIFAAMDNFMTSVVSHAHSTNQPFPYVNLPDYGNRVSKLKSMEAVLAVWVMVLVKPEERSKYEDFAWQTKRSLANETLKIQATDPGYRGDYTSEAQFNYSIHGDYEPIPYNVTRNFMVLSQQYPVTSFEFPAFNWDWYSTTGNEYLYRMMEKGQPLLSQPYVLPDPNIPDEVAQAEYWGNLYGKLIPPDENAVEPICDICFPIYDKLDKIQLTSQDANASSIAGAVTSTFYWRDMIKNILPEARTSIDVVFDNPCKAKFTYRVNGGSVKYAGRGDHHDTDYDSTKAHSSLLALKNQSKVTSRYTGVPIDEEFCPYSISIYPTRDYEQEFTTNNPIIFALFIVLVFAMVCIAFLLYDSKVEKRQEVVMDSALRSNAVVTSLFPSAVRDRILNNANIGSGGTMEFTTNDVNDKVNSSSKNTILNNQTSKSLTASTGGTNGVCLWDTPPIADLYPETTVLFADIAGFTKWSASRGPNDVFVMLETVYGAFDNIARELGIFKVETIGDSYVAVVGLPVPRENHASAMVEFSKRVLIALKEATTVLATTLGSDVQTLNLRIGLNSGPTTAGVLRGEKSRFQLFGDTVNTAARMESNGLPGRIHCSESTAKCLIAEGYNEADLVKRDTLIEVKGKGTLQTYWVENEEEDDVMANI